jgi:hypothetical protein
MTRRPTLSEQHWPTDAHSTAQARQWAADAAVQVLDWTWRSFDRLKAIHLSKVDVAQPLEQLERNLAALHFVELNILWAQETGGYSSVTPILEWSELESRPAAPGKPPAYDFAFVFNENQRAAWPIEAKVVPTPNTVAAYLSDVAKFVSGVAAPLTSEGGVIAYLLSGPEVAFFAALEPKLGEPLAEAVESALSGRAHRISHHERSSAPQLRLHHLAMLCAR